MPLPKKLNTSVILDSEVLNYLKELGHRYRRSRSFLINVIVQEHAHRSKQIENKDPQPLL